VSASDPRIVVNSQIRPPEADRWKKIVIVVIVVIAVLAAYLLVVLLTPPVRVYTGGCFCQIPKEIWLSQAQSTSSGSNTWYNFSLLKLNTTVPIGDLSPQIDNPAGAIVYPVPWQFVVLHPGSPNPLAKFNWTSETWGAGGSTDLATHDIFSLNVGASNVAGYALVFIGQGAVQSAEKLPLP